MKNSDDVIEILESILEGSLVNIVLYDIRVILDLNGMIFNRLENV